MGGRVLHEDSRENEEGRMLREVRGSRVLQGSRQDGLEAGRRGQDLCHLRQEGRQTLLAKRQISHKSTRRAVSRGAFVFTNRNLPLDNRETQGDFGHAGH